MNAAAPVIVTAAMGGADQAWAARLRQAHFPPERNFLDAHITLFHHLPPQCLPEIKRRIQQLARENASPRASLSRLLLLGRGVAFHIHSPALLAMRRELADAFRGLLTPQDQAEPRLHITIQNKVEPHVAKRLKEELERGFQPRPLQISGLAAYYYRGGPWDKIGAWKFRGK